MKGLNRISVVSTAESALKKLKKASIPVYDCEKRGADFVFGVKDEHLKKVFAIFAKPCYNIRVDKKSTRGRFLSFAALRAGMIAGALVFALAAFIANFYILRIEISGNGGYLSGEITGIVADEGAACGKPFSGFNQSLATGRILALPQVTFCNISKKGSVLVIDVRVDEAAAPSARRKPLTADVDGVLENLVVVCGTPALETGSEVKAGDILIFAHNIVGERTIDCLAVGYADIRCAKSAEYLAAADDETSRREALASLGIEEENIVSAHMKAVSVDGGVLFKIDYEFRHRVSVNLT